MAENVFVGSGTITFFLEGRRGVFFVVVVLLIMLRDLLTRPPPPPPFPHFSLSVKGKPWPKFSPLAKRIRIQRTIPMSFVGQMLNS